MIITDTKHTSVVPVTSNGRPSERTIPVCFLTVYVGHIELYETVGNQKMADTAFNGQGALAAVKPRPKQYRWLW